MKSLALCVALLSFGCETTPPEPKVAVQAPAPAPPSAAAPQEPPKPKSEDNILRKHQLRTLKKVELRAGAHRIQAWVMDTASKREEGMMWLTEEEVNDNEGMLFVFKNAAQRGFWMQNTYLPLDILFISASGKVLNIQRGNPLDETSLPSKGPAKYVLELKAGRAAKMGLKAGAGIVIPQGLKAAD